MFNMLNMSSVEVEPPAGERDTDRTARARVRDAAIACFADQGVAATSVRTIAAAAGVSPALVIHHFGSKDDLRIACDQHVASLVREQKSAAMAQGPGMDPLAALRTYGDGPPLLAYLARTLVDGSPHVAELVDDLIADAVDYMQQGVEAGVLTPTDDPHGRAAVLTLWSLGALVLHEHVARALGADLLGGDPMDALPYFRPGLDVMGAGLLRPEVYERLRTQLRQIEEDES
ncbi:TetR/AcrR family transcriptional regulator [Egicoccus sp. AB-alg6-2]|uniref:TetR/AcrR family transcriptional regulator n=1 Tax=Egicoccus sp. AB-alg6-2 TaxID=3242692 RepID=UPI00359CC9BC